MQGPYLRKYGVETVIDFRLVESDGVDFRVDAAHAVGDTKIMKDEGAEANTTNAFADEGQGYSITLTVAEMQAARIVVYVVDQTAPKAWLDTALEVETYGHASAMHAFDLDTATVNLSAASETQIDAIETDTNELQTDLVDGGRLDLLIDAILADTGTDGVVIAVATQQAIADEVLKRGVGNVEATADAHSLACVVLAALEAAISGTTLTIYRTDGTTVFTTKTITKDPTADPITAVT